MKSIKPGRGPSMMSGVAGIFMIVIGIGWTIVAAQVHWLMLLFGICWTGIAISKTVYSFKNANSRNRHSVFDIVDSQEEPDPLNTRFKTAPSDRPGTTVAFCPYCGTQVDAAFDYCSACGKKLPD